MRYHEVILLFFSLMILSHRGGAVAAEGYIYKKEESISSVFQGGDTSGWASCHYLNGKCDALYDGVNWYPLSDSEFHILYLGYIRLERMYCIVFSLILRKREV